MEFLPSANYFCRVRARLFIMNKNLYGPNGPDQDKDKNTGFFRNLTDNVSRRLKKAGEDFQKQPTKTLLNEGES